MLILTYVWKIAIRIQCDNNVIVKSTMQIKNQIIN